MNYTIGDSRFWLNQRPGAKLIYCYEMSEWICQAIHPNGLQIEARSSLDIDSAMNEAIRAYEKMFEQAI